MKHLAFLALLAAALLALPGCISPEEARANRIQDNYSLFEQLPAEVQERVSIGTLAIGDPSTAVWLAHGTPGKRATNTTQDGTSEVWQYFRQVSEPYEVWVDAPLPPPPPPRGGHHAPPPPGYGFIGPHYETRYRFVSQLVMQFEFVNGAVTKIQTFE